MAISEKRNLILLGNFFFLLHFNSCKEKAFQLYSITRPLYTKYIYLPFLCDIKRPFHTISHVRHKTFDTNIFREYE